MILATIRTLLIVFGVILCLQDIKSKSVGILPLGGFCIAAFVNYFFIHEACFVPFLILTSIGLITKLFQKRKVVGTADYVVFFAISFILKYDKWPLFMMLCGGIGVLIALISKTKRIPFIPVILLSLLLCCSS